MKFTQHSSFLVPTPLRLTLTFFIRAHSPSLPLLLLIRRPAVLDTHQSSYPLTKITQNKRRPILPSLAARRHIPVLNKPLNAYPEPGCETAGLDPYCARVDNCIERERDRLRSMREKRKVRGSWCQGAVQWLCDELQYCEGVVVAELVRVHFE